jgi:branched-chain amino acid transport system ATP-binding protein
VSGLLEAVGVGVRFGRLKAVDDVSFTLDEGEIVGLVGPNGAGKTTLVGVLSGTLREWTGDVVFDGDSIRGLRPSQLSRRGSARTFQAAQPFTRMTVRENVMVGVLYGGKSRVSLEVAEERSQGLLDGLDLAEKGDLPAESLNPPERKRLEIARALATDPRVLLLDEALAGLNAVEIESAVALIRGVRERGVAIVLIEHVMHAIEQLAFRGVVPLECRKLLDDTPGAVFADEQFAEAYLVGRTRDEPGRDSRAHRLD